MVKDVFLSAPSVGVEPTASPLGAARSVLLSYEGNEVKCSYHEIVRRAGVEPARPEGHRNLNPARLPVQPSPLA